MEQLEQANEELMGSVREMAQSTEGQSQLEELRKRMAEMAKGEIEKI